MFGLSCNKVVLVQYTSEWLEIFRREKQSLQRVLGPYVWDIEHIGSTAVPGIVAKPIVDILALLHHASDIDRCKPLLDDLGYTYKGEQEIPGWHFFCKRERAKVTHHLHIFPRDNTNWRRYLLFRDYLCDHSTVAVAYVVLKKRLAERYADDRVAYTAGKSAFIQSVVELAEHGQLPFTLLSDYGISPLFFALLPGVQVDCPPYS
jgi:GrpB-like predicted nucleotidyltransferase (UPF0157 family)